MPFRGRALTVLVPIVFIVAFIVTLTGAVLENNLRAAKGTLNAAVARFSDVTMTDGVADFTHGLARVVRLNGAGGPWSFEPSTSALKSSCAAALTADCPFRYRIRATITAGSGSAASGAGDSASNLQAAIINEQRVSASVTVTIVGSTGATLGTRTRFLTYRVFDTAPYAVISGSRDSATVNGAASAAQGDSGGAAGTPVADAASPGGFDDTRIHVRLTCRTIIENVVPFSNDQQPAGNDGLPWGNAAQAAYEAPCPAVDAAADIFRDEQWGNGDTNSSGWTQ
jgi:hypothetical protein